MATATRKTDDSKPAPAKDKAKEEPEGVGVKEVAAHLKTDPRSLRAFLRRTERAVGRGTRHADQLSRLVGQDSTAALAEIA